MVFVNSLLLWGILGAIGISVPIIIHLFNKFKPKKVQWGAMELLRRTLQTRSKQVKTEDWIILVLRCLALFLIALALLRPAFSGDGDSVLGEQRRGVVFVIDGSYSMAHGELKSRFDVAKEQVRELAAEVPSGSPVSVVLLGRQPRVLLRGAAYDPRQFDRVLDEMEVLPEPARLDDGIDAALELAEEIALPTRSVYIVTDTQRSDWDPLPPTTAERLRKLAEVASVTVVPVAEAGGANVGVVDFRFASGALRLGASARYVAELRNFGDVTVSGSLRLDVDGLPVDTRDVADIDPGASAFVFFTLPWDEAGDRRLSVHFMDDDLDLDNARYQVASVPEAVRVLCIDGTPAGGADERETFFLARALQLHRSGMGQGMEVRVAPFFDLATELDGDEQLVILANVTSVDADERARLGQLLERGGNLLVALGDQVDPARLSDSLGDLLPAQLGERKVGTGADARRLQLGEPGHAVVEELARIADYVHDVTVTGLVVATPKDGARVLIETEDGEPVLIEQAIGRGRALLWTTSLDRAWTSAPVSPVYPILLHQLIGHLTASSRSSLAVGQDLRLSVPASEVGLEVVMRTPDDERVVGTTTRDEEMATLDFGQLKQPGFYAVRVAEDVGVRYAAVNIDGQEGATSALGRDAAATALEGTGVAVAGTGPVAEGDAQESLNEIWRLLLLLGLICFLIQAWLSDRFTKRKMAATKPIKVGFGAGVAVQ